MGKATHYRALSARHQHQSMLGGLSDRSGRRGSAGIEPLWLYRRPPWLSRLWGSLNVDYKSLSTARRRRLCRLFQERHAERKGGVSWSPTRRRARLRETQESGALWRAQRQGSCELRGEKRGTSWATLAQPQPIGTLPSSPDHMAPESRRASCGGRCRCFRPLPEAQRRLRNSWDRRRSRSAKASRPSTDRTAGLRFPDGSAAGFRRMATVWLQNLGPAGRASAAFC